MRFSHVKIELDKVAHNKQNDILPNELNMRQFKSLLRHRLQTKRFIVHQSSSDADKSTVNALLHLLLVQMFVQLLQMILTFLFLKIFILYCIKTQQIRTEHCKFEKCN